MGAVHQTVLLQEAVDLCVTRRDGVYVDATFGRGGHSAAILGVLEGEGTLIALDKDPEAIAEAQRRFGGDRRFSAYHASFADMKTILRQRDLLGKVNGILLDLGVSSPQLDTPERGFSFQHDGPLDMRMNPQQGISAREWLAGATVEEMADVFRAFGEERHARRIARALVEARAVQPIETTRQLAELVRAAHPAWEPHKHPATRVFQAIRIAINRELEELQLLLDGVLDVLAVGGRLVVISFHSLEDRLVKTFIRDQARGHGAMDRALMRLPVLPLKVQQRLQPLGKALRPSDREVQDNPRARSAILRAAEKRA